MNLLIFLQIYKEEMTSPTKRTRVCSNMSEIFQHTAAAQTRALARATKETATRENVRHQMRLDCERLGIKDLDNDLPPVVHIAGTKGTYESIVSTRTQN